MSKPRIYGSLQPYAPNARQGRRTHKKAYQPPRKAGPSILVAGRKIKEKEGNP